VSNTLPLTQRFTFCMKLTLKLIEQAIALGETGNFAKAAERLGISQPTLSRNIATLEQDLGLTLFDRGRTGAHATVFGRLLMERGQLVLREAGALHDELMAVAGMDVGQLRIVAGPYAVEDPIADAVAQLSNERPGLRIRITQVGPDEISPAVLSREHELGIGGVENQTPHEHLVVEPLKHRRLYLACRPGHPLLAGRPTLAQVLSFPLVTVLLKGRAFTFGAAGVRAGAMDAGRQGFSPAIEVNSFDAAHRIVRMTDALFPATATMLAADLAAGHVATLDFDNAALRATPALVRLKDRTLSPAARRFLAIVQDIEAALPDLPGH
jgi:DNA-binding transcriptional LysR family regulator